MRDENGNAQIGVFAGGLDVDHAAARAAEFLENTIGGDTWEVNEWRPA